jgi:hypothetical protein
MPPNVPYAGDLVSGERDKKVLKLLSNPAQLGKPFALSREAPAERVAILRTAFDAALHDPALLAEAEKLKVDISPRTAAECNAILEEIFSMPQDVVDAAKQMIAD